jgi:hypothetical protein
VDGDWRGRPRSFASWSLRFMNSRNMPEHIPDLHGAFQSMASVLARGGSAVHLCPDLFRTLGTELRHPRSSCSCEFVTPIITST